MSHIELFREASRVYAAGGNVSRHFKDRGLSREEQIAIIEFAYDLQSGSYTAALRGDQGVRDQKRAWGGVVAERLARYGARSLVEAGVGEATTLKSIVEQVPADAEAAGFDLCVSRLVYAREVLAETGRPVRLFTGDLSSIPLVDNAYDALLTNHSIEPNGGRERQILAEMLRATRRLLVLVEPDYERGSAGQRQRMDELGYIKNLPAHIEALGAKVLEYTPWQLNPNPLNAASLIVAEKPRAANWNEPVGLALASPYSKGALVDRGGFLFSESDNLAFPMIDGFPCLLPANAIVASHLNPAIRKRL